MSQGTNKNAPHFCEAFGAENETRTRDPDLGKVVLYQLSYFRRMSKTVFVERDCKDTAKIRISKLFLSFLQRGPGFDPAPRIEIIRYILQSGGPGGR